MKRGRSDDDDDQRVLSKEKKEYIMAWLDTYCEALHPNLVIPRPMPEQKREAYLMTRMIGQVGCILTEDFDMLNRILTSHFERKLHIFLRSDKLVIDPSQFTVSPDMHYHKSYGVGKKTIQHIIDVLNEEYYGRGIHDLTVLTNLLKVFGQRLDAGCTLFHRCVKNIQENALESAEHLRPVLYVLLENAWRQHLLIHGYALDAIIKNHAKQMIYQRVHFRSDEELRIFPRRPKKQQRASYNAKVQVEMKPVANAVVTVLSSYSKYFSFISLQDEQDSQPFQRTFETWRTLFDDENMEIIRKLYIR